MNIGLDDAILWFEKKRFILQKRKTYLFMTLCMVAGIGSFLLNLMSYSQAITLTWIVITMISSNRITLSCCDSGMKNLIAMKGNVVSVIINKLYYPFIRLEIYLVLYTLIMYAIMSSKEQGDFVLLFRSVLCMIATPITMIFAVITYFLLRGIWRTLVHIFLIIIYNILFVAEEMNSSVYYVEMGVLAILLIISVNLSKKLTGEALLTKGAGR